MNKIIVLLALLPACAAPLSSSAVINTPDGKLAAIIRCNGSRADEGSCLEEASKVCPNGYTILASDEKEGSSSFFLLLMPHNIMLAPILVPLGLFVAR